MTEDDSEMARVRRQLSRSIGTNLMLGLLIGNLTTADPALRARLEKGLDDMLKDFRASGDLPPDILAIVEETARNMLPKAST